jgi:hypothetical protein
MFIPFNDINEKIYAYDVNSLYPYAMSNFDMPVGYPTYFEGDISYINKDAFGFFEVNVITPKTELPILPYKNILKGHSTTLFPTGS